LRWAPVPGDRRDDDAPDERAGGEDQHVVRREGIDGRVQVTFKELNSQGFASQTVDGRVGDLLGRAVACSQIYPQDVAYAYSSSPNSRTNSAVGRPSASQPRTP